jgi:NAD(P)-dependent dehydrogenase (short-subunit alcohol dehydrogenase family)
LLAAVQNRRGSTPQGFKMALTLEHRVIVVTGGFGTLGRALADVLGQQGALLALVDRAQIPPDMRETERTSLLGGIDLGVQAAFDDALLQIVRRWQRIDGLVNVAGGFAWESVGQGSLETWDRMYSMNLRSAVAASQAVLPHLSAGGRIVNVGAMAALKAAGGMGAYAASKAGVLRFTEALAEELKDRGVTVNAVLPSIIDTPANRADMPKADFDRWVTPQALSRVVAFLLSDDAAAITGACLPVTGRV